MRSAIKPVNQACTGVLYPMTVSGQWPISRTLVHDQLHVLDATVEMCMEVPRQCRKSYFILFISLVFNIGDVHGVAEDPLLREKLVDKGIPIREVILSFWALLSGLAINRIKI
jgi:hypothetical protein